MSENRTLYDVVIVGGGPGGLAGALALGRARKRVLLCDAGPRRNAAASHIHNFVTRDGTPPDEFRAIGRDQLGRYPNVTVRDVGVDAIAGSRGAFRVELSGGESVDARRMLLCTGMVDELVAIDGFRELWGHAIFQCPYCHGWEARDQPWGYLVLPATAGHLVPFAIQARSWTREVTVFTNGVVIADDARAPLEAAGIRIAMPAISRLVGQGGRLEAVALGDGTTMACSALFAHPPQHQVEVVRQLGVAVDDDGYVKIDPVTRETSVRGIYAAGDLTSRMQGAIVAAAASVQAAAMINVELSLELAASGAL
jgi:thioredoxin reductase